MTLSKLWDSLLAILRKDSKGLAVSPDDFTKLLQVENLSLFNEYYRAFEAAQVVTDSLQRVKEFAELDLTYRGDIHANYVALPSDYVHLTGCYVGADKLDTDWQNNGTPPYDIIAYTQFNTCTESNGYISSLIGIALPGQTKRCFSYDITVSPSADYSLKVTVTDNDISQNSDGVDLHVWSSNGTTASAIAAKTLVAGDNFINFTATTNIILLTLTLSDSGNCDYSINFELYEDDGELPVIDVVTDEEWITRRYDELTKPTAEYPICMIADGNIYVAPKAVNNIFLYYLRQPTDPFFDYYIDANLNIVPMAVGTSHTLGAGEEYRDGTTTGAKTSTTVELEWEDIDQIKILHRLLAKLGVSMDEQLVAQYAISEKNS